MDNPDILLLRQGALITGKSRVLNEWESKRLVGRFGLPLPGGHCVPKESVVSAADQVGYPVVIKGVSDSLPHKTEAGAVVLNLKCADEVSAAAEAIANRLIEQGLISTPFLIEPMVSDAVAELIIGLKRDQQFGLVLVLGSGGIMVSVLHDSATLLLPITREAVKDALFGLKGSKLMTGYRGRPEGDTEAVVDAVMAVAGFAHTYWESVTELDINPLMVRPKGKGVVAADAFVRFQD